MNPELCHCYVSWWDQSPEYSFDPEANYTTVANYQHTIVTNFIQKITYTIYTEEHVPYFLYSIPHCAFVSSPIQIPDQILPVCDFHYKILYI